MSTQPAPATIQPAFYRVKDVAAMLAVSDWEVRRLAEAGVLHKRPVGQSKRQYRITAQSVHNYIDALLAGGDE